MARGQKWGTYETANATHVLAHMDILKKEAFKSLAKKKNLTVSAYVNKLISLELIRNHIDDPSLSVELGQ